MNKPASPIIASEVTQWMQRVRDKLAMLHGDPPYNTGSNINRGDPYFAMQITREFGFSPAKLAEIVGYKRQDPDARVKELEAQVAKLKRCLLPIQMGLAEMELVDGPVYDEEVALNYSGSGASDSVTVGQIREAMKDPDA